MPFLPGLGSQLRAAPSAEALGLDIPSVRDSGPKRPLKSLVHSVR